MLKSRIRLLGGEYVVSTPEEIAGRIRTDIAKWRDLAARANIRAEWTDTMRIAAVEFLGVNVPRRPIGASCSCERRTA